MSLEPVEVIAPRWGRGGWKPPAGEAVFSLAAGNPIYKEGRTLSLERDLGPVLLGLNKSSRSQVALDSLSQPHPPPLPSDHTLSVFFSIIEGTRRQSSPERREGFLLPQEFPSGCPRNISQKGKSHGDRSAAWIKPLSETHRTDSLSPGFQLENIFFSFFSSFSYFLKGNLRLSCWDEKMEVSLLVALNIFPDNTLCWPKSSLFFISSLGDLVELGPKTFPDLATVHWHV